MHENNKNLVFHRIRTKKYKYKKHIYIKMFILRNYVNSKKFTTKLTLDKDLCTKTIKM